ncbi:MAG: hypothetical protein ACP6IP_08715 [Candidatus Njordarchaeia archaeon]
MTERTIYVIINSDTDPAIEPINSKFDKETAWDTTINIIQQLKEELKRIYLQDTYPKIIWHLRSDEQIYKLWGDWAFPAFEYQTFFKQLENDGDMISWHLHLWRFNKENNTWYQETQDQRWIQNCLERGYQRLSKLFEISTVRMGWNFHNNFTMSLIAKLGIKVDLSGVPGDKNNKSSKKLWGEYDWEITPRKPYFPSVRDYRVPGNVNLPILEVPLTTFKFPRYIHPLYSCLTGRKVSSPNLFKNPLLMKYGIKYVVKILKSSNDLFVVFSSTFHPGDVLKDPKLFSIEYGLENISYLITLSEKENIKIEFTTPLRLYSKIVEDLGM